MKARAKKAWNGGRNLMKDPWTVEEFNRNVPAGTDVIVVEDSGEITRTKTRSDAWAAGKRGLVLLEGRTGGFDMDRVAPA